MTNPTPATDATQSLIDSSESQLRQARSTLDDPHTSHSHFVTINDLPREILAHIFTLVKLYCKHDGQAAHWCANCNFVGRHKCQFLRWSASESVSKVCAYWRNVSASTPTLWTHVDLSIGQPQDASFTSHAQRSLERTKQLPLHIHIECNISSSDPQAFIALLAPYANRIVSVDISGNILTAQSILLGLFSTAYRGSVQSLTLGDSESQELRESRRGASLFSTGLLDEFLLSLRSLTLQGPSLEYNSPAFWGLTALTLGFSRMRPTPCQLTQILAGSPKLRSFTLVGLSLTPGDLPSSAANLSSLQTLDLSCMTFDEVSTITSCIIPGQGLRVGLAPNIDRSYVHDLSPLLPFFRQFHIARLFLKANYMSRGLNLETILGPLGDPLPSLEELAVDGALLRDSKVDGGLLAERFPRLHTLHITGESFSVDQLKMMLASSPIRTVRLRRSGRHPSEVLQAISEVVPSVLYSLHNPARWSDPFLWDLPAICYSKNGVS